MNRMCTIDEIRDLREIYDYQKQINAPYIFPVDFESWKKSFLDDIDGEGRRLFQNSAVKAAYVSNKLVGYIQYGNTAFGFDKEGEISDAVSYPVIRSFYFDRQYEETGRRLLEEALNHLQGADRVYAFFHYFGMSCYARHGKLFEKYTYIENLLQEYGFVAEHENVYYSSTIHDVQQTNIKIAWHTLTAGNQQLGDFTLDGSNIGNCEAHLLENGIAYLRWIYVNDDIQNQGIGSKCMSALKASLAQKGFARLDTDTAIGNCRAQHFYEKNQFIREGITRSYYRNPDQK